MSESRILKEIQVGLSNGPMRLFRNNCGALQDAKGRYVRFGVGSPGGADLLGFRSVVITPEMVGRTVAIFLAVEVKDIDGRVTPDQQRFLDTVNSFGGIGIVAHSDYEAMVLIQGRVDTATPELKEARDRRTSRYITERKRIEEDPLYLTGDRQHKPGRPKGITRDMER